jgi:hypothetical protein
MRHALDWHDKDWQGFLQVVENLSTSRQAKATGQPVRASIE